MWWSWRRKSASRVSGAVGRHRVAAPREHSLMVNTPPPYADQIPPGTVGLVFRDGTEYRIAPIDPLGQALRDLAAQMTARQLVRR